jgi:hypothetical protein
MSDSSSTTPSTFHPRAQRKRLSIAAMRIGNEYRSPVGINR